MMKNDYQTHAFTSWLHWIIYNLAWPSFRCENCVEVEGYNCYCSYHDAVAPGKGPAKWHLFWRWVWDHRA